MNSKKNKNKKQNKQPNPPQKSEISNPVAEKIESVEQNPEKNPEAQINEDRAPEIKSECVTPAVAEIPESDAPKKPKRNRGKKKKSESENISNAEIQQKDLENKVEVAEGVELKTDTIADTPKEQPLCTTKVEPNARKKKNKNNDGQDSSDYQKTAAYLAAQPLKVTMLSKSEAESIMSDVKIITCVPIATEGSEPDGRKKKNKKKKRTDSEKSEKEEILACTAAFQKLLTREDNKDTKVEQNVSDIKTTAEKETAEHISLDMILKETLKPNTEQIEDKDTVTDEDNKGKKKNKKDKKYPPKVETEIETKQVLKDATDLLLTATSEQVNVPVEPTIAEENPITKKEEPISPKSKAKFAKPVEKKMKDLKTDAFLEEPLEKIGPDSAVVVQSLSCSDLIPPEKCSEQKPEQEIGNTADKKSRKITDTKNESSEQMKSNIQVAKEIAGKKGRKSPKPPKGVDELKSEVQVETTENSEQTLEIVEMPPLMPITEIDESEKETKTIDTPDKIKNEMQKVSTSSQLSSESNIKREEMVPKIIPLPFTTLETGYTKPVDIEIESSEQKSIAKEEEKQGLQENVKDKATEPKIETFHHIPSPDGGMGKKRKKSPKPPQKRDIVQEYKPTSREFSVCTESVHENPKAAPADLTLFKDKNTEIKHEVTESKPMCSKNTEEPQKSEVNLPVQNITHTKCDKAKEKQEKNFGDIEVSSVRTVSESSLCDINPTIDYPRSSSQGADGNNNVLITEMVSAPESVTETKLDLPIIKGADVPSSKIQLSIKIPKEETKKARKSEEKTDLKSKMMEVNQDMEGLRRSIEKSLAELSAIKNTEESTEQQFLLAQDKLDLIKNMALKQQDNIKESVSQKTESTEAVLPKSEFSADIVSLTTPKESEFVVDEKPKEENTSADTPKTPEPPARKDNKGKGKSKKKGKQDTEQSASNSSSATSATTANEPKDNKSTTQDSKEKEKSNKSQEKGKQQSTTCDEHNTIAEPEATPLDISNSDLDKHDPIEKFVDALTSNVDDVNQSFEMIASDSTESQINPKINVTEPTEETDKSEKDKTDNQSKINPVSQPKNLLGHPAIPARSSKMDYKKEKNKTPNTDQAKVNIKDSVPIESKRECKDTQTENKKRFLKNKTIKESVSSMANENEEYVYKYSFRRVFLPNACHVCKSDLRSGRIPCNSCNLVFYCSPKHKDEDYAQHQALCFAVSTITRLKDQKHLYANAANITGQDYRLLRMQMIISCEKVLERRLIPCEQEMLLYPRVCAEATCREWRQELLKDCDGCGQISYCTDHPNHLPKTHQRWCKSYNLYHKLVTYQQVKGRLKPKLPSKVMTGQYQLPDKMNEVLASMYEEKIDMSDIQYAALTQVATAPLTAAYCAQLHSQQINSSNANGMQKKSTFTIQVVGAEMQFEADVLNKWEIFFLHLRPDVTELTVVLIGPDLNSANLPLDLLGKVKLCANCRQNKRRVVFDFQDKRSYYEYWSSDFTIPDIVCAFNPSIQRSSVFNGKDTWPSTIKCILKQNVPFVVTSYTMNELHRDLARIKECYNNLKIVSEPKYNTFASVRPDRNFISDDEMPLLFKNYCFMVVCGAF